MKFMLISSNDYWKTKELLEYVDKLYEAGYAITKYDKEFFISVKDFEDLKRVCTILEQFSVIIHFSTKGDEPTLEIYDDWRE